MTDPSRALGAAPGVPDKLSRLYAVMVLGILMTELDDEAEILRLATSAVRGFDRCSTEAVLLRRGEGLYRHYGADDAADTGSLRDPQTDGLISSSRRGWAWAYPLKSTRGVFGCIIVGAEQEPSPDEQFLLGVLTQQAGLALSSAYALDDQRRANERLREDVTRLQEQARIMQALAEASGEEEAIAELAEVLCSLTQLPVSIEGQFGHRLAWASPDGVEPLRLSQRHRSRVLADVRQNPELVKSGAWWVAGARSAGEVLGLVALHDPGDQANEARLFALEHARTVLSVQLQHSRLLAQSELRSRRDLAEELLSGVSGDATVSARAAALGHDLSVPQQIVAVGWDVTPSEQALSRLLDAMAASLDSTFFSVHREHSVILIAPVSRRWADAHRVAHAKREASGIGLNFGVGGPCEVLSRLPRSYDEATQALSVHQASGRPPGVTDFQELGFFRVLAGGHANPELRRYMRDWIGALIDYDDEHGADLVPTLSTFLERGGHYDRTASALIIHRSTLRYRLNRIRDLTGLNLSDTDTRFNLHVATRAWKLQTTI